MRNVATPPPDATRPAADFLALQALFTGAGFDLAGVCQRLGLKRLSEIQPDRVREVDSGPLMSARDVLIRLFVEGHPVPLATATQHLSASGVQLLASFGLVVPFGEDAIGATVALYPVEHLLIASDRYNNLDGSMHVGYDDVVYPCLFTTTERFLDLIPQGKPVGDVLDLCAGTGVAALLLARTANRVVAADITLRCETFARFNAGLNGITNFEAVTGDLYHPVAGQQFDCIVVHPPLQPVLEHIATFNSGGLDGEQITRRVISDAAPFLKPGGRLYCLCQLTDREQPVEIRVRSWLTESLESEMDVAFYCVRHVDLPYYTSVETLREGRGMRTWKEWLNAFTQAGAKEMVYGMVMVQRRASNREVFTARKETPKLMRDSLEGLLHVETLAQRPDFVQMAMSMKARALPGSQLIVRHKLEDPVHWGEPSYELKRTFPVEFAVPVSSLAANVLAQMNGQKTGAELLQAFSGDIDPEDYANLLRNLLVQGFIHLS